jgi:hypothetical protein
VVRVGVAGAVGGGRARQHLYAWVPVVAAWAKWPLPSAFTACRQGPRGNQAGGCGLLCGLSSEPISPRKHELGRARHGAQLQGLRTNHSEARGAAPTYRGGAVHCRVLEKAAGLRLVLGSGRVRDGSLFGLQAPHSVRHEPPLLGRLTAGSCHAMLVRSPLLRVLLSAQLLHRRTGLGVALRFWALVCS